VFRQITLTATTAWPKETLLSKVPSPADNIYRIRGEIDPEQAPSNMGGCSRNDFGDGPVRTWSFWAWVRTVTQPRYFRYGGAERNQARCVSHYVES